MFRSPPAVTLASSLPAEEEAALADARARLATYRDDEAAIRRSLAALEEQRQALMAETATLRRTRSVLTEEVAAAEARYAQVAERTLDARERRQALASEVMGLCNERAELVQRVSALRIAAMQLEAGQLESLQMEVRQMPVLSMPVPLSPLPPAASTLLPAAPSPPASVPTPRRTAAAAPAASPPAAPVASDSRNPLLAPSGKVVATWTARARSTVKPRNDSYETGPQTVWRRNEDRFRLATSGTGTGAGTGMLAAVADGAGASGLYCGAWAETLVNRLPDAPVTGLEGLNEWLDAFCLEFRQTMVAQCKSDPPKHSKFVREGSFATLTACWLRAGEDGAILHWLGYGDSPLLVFDRTGGEPALMLSHPASLAAMDRDPHLLNWKVLPEAQRLSGGALALPARATVVLASDGVGQYLLLRHLAAARQNPALGGTLGGEFARLANDGSGGGSGGGRMGTAAKAHASRPMGGVAEAHAEIWDSLASDPLFASLVAAQCDEGLMANDDSTVIMVKIDRGRS